MRTRFGSLLIAGMLGVVPVAVAGEAPAKRSPDNQFVNEAATGGRMEVELGRTAATHARSAEVKRFGARMVADHSKANQELKGLAQRKSIALPATLDEKQRKTMDELSKLKGAEFDRAYMKAMVADHEEDVDKFRQMAKSAEDPDVKAFAAKTLPTLEEHLRMAQEVAGSVGATASR